MTPSGSHALAADIEARWQAVDKARSRLMNTFQPDIAPEPLVKPMIALGRALNSVHLPARDPARWSGRIGKLAEDALQTARMVSARLGTIPDNPECVLTAVLEGQEGEYAATCRLRNILTRAAGLGPKRRSPNRLADLLACIDSYVRAALPPTFRAEGSGASEHASKAAVQANPAKKSKGKLIDERMAKMLNENAESLNWTAEKWARELACVKSTVVVTGSWQTIQNARALAEAKRREQQRDGKPADRRRFRRNRSAD